MKPLLHRLHRLTKRRHLLTFSAKLRFAAQEPSVLIGLPKVLTVLATLLLAILGVGVGASSAAAHGSHSHQIAVGTSGSAYLSRTEAQQSSTIETAIAGDATQPVLPDEHGKSDCCCGSILCHAGVTLTVDVIPLLCPPGARVTAEPSSGGPQRNASGLERPPRTTYIA